MPLGCQDSMSFLELKKTKKLECVLLGSQDRSIVTLAAAQKRHWNQALVLCMQGRFACLGARQFLIQASFTSSPDRDEVHADCIWHSKETATSLDPDMSSAASDNEISPVA